MDKDLRTQASPQNPEDSQKHNPDRLIFSLPLLSQDAAQLWMCVWPLPTQQELEETLRKQLLIVSYHCTGIKFLIYEVRASSTAGLSGQQMGDRTQQSHNPLQYAADTASCRNVSKCRQHPFNTDGNIQIQIALLWRRAPICTGRNGFSPASLTELSVIGCEPCPSLVGARTVTQTRTDTTIPDDVNEDIASLSKSASLQQSNFQSCPFVPLELLAL